MWNAQIHIPVLPPFLYFKFNELKYNIKKLTWNINVKIICCAAS